jgi:hypothetical protein
MKLVTSYFLLNLTSLLYLKCNIIFIRDMKLLESSPHSTLLGEYEDEVWHEID